MSEDDFELLNTILVNIIKEYDKININKLEYSMDFGVVEVKVDLRMN